MTLLIGASVALLTQVWKLAVDKFGYEISRFAILAFVFIVSLIYSFLVYKNILTPEFLKMAGKIIIAAIATYELIIKTFLDYLDSKK